MLDGTWAPTDASLDQVKFGNVMAEATMRSHQSKHLNENVRSVTISHFVSNGMKEGE